MNETIPALETAILAAVDGDFSEALAWAAELLCVEAHDLDAGDVEAKLYNKGGVMGVQVLVPATLLAAARGEDPGSYGCDFIEVVVDAYGCRRP